MEKRRMEAKAAARAAVYVAANSFADLGSK
jgi:hypothetical protein